ncbi:unnamed protein product, partial [Meganyctiphanes norvegica]
MSLLISLVVSMYMHCAVELPDSIRRKLQDEVFFSKCVDFIFDSPCDTAHAFSNVHKGGFVCKFGKQIAVKNQKGENLGNMSFFALNSNPSSRNDPNRVNENNVALDFDKRKTKYDDSYDDTHSIYHINIHWGETMHTGERPYICSHEDLVEVNFTGVVAKASGSNEKYPPNYAFQGSFWHSNKPFTLPCFLWFEFPVPIRVVKYSFTSRPDDGKLAVKDGPSKYSFWGSNHTDCSQETSRVVLQEDNSGTPFSSDNKTKTKHIPRSNFYRCYGFTVTDVPGRDHKGQYIT